jgi:voltage-gated potassium channel
MLVLCLRVLLTLGAGTFFSLSEDTRIIFLYADNTTCVLFFLDFLYSFCKAPNRIRYLTTWGWIDLLSSIPT